MESYIELLKDIEVTPDYPTEGINFIDLSHVMSNAAHLMPLLRIACANLAVDADAVLVGVPTRGCTLAILMAIASGMNCRVVQLQKAGAGTPMPRSSELCSAGTVYSGGRQTTFLIDAAGRAALAAARRVLLCDDVIESGSTLGAVAAAIDALRPINDRVVDRTAAFCILSIGHPAAEQLALQRYVLMHKPLGAEAAGAQHGIVLGSALMPRPLLLGTLRGAPVIPRRVAAEAAKLNVLPVAVYGPPSMSAHVLAYAAANSCRFVGDARWESFPGGCPNLSVAPYDSIHDVVFLFDAQPGSSESQQHVLRELARNCRGAMRIIVPFMPQATMERADAPGTVATAKTFLDALCADLPIVAGRITLEIIDIHQSGEAYYVPTNVRFEPTSILRRLVYQERYAVVAFPDAGAHKRYGHAFRGFTHVVCDKIREGAKRSIIIRQVVGPLPIAGAEIVLVDDLTRTGGTLMECAAALKARGASKVHAVFVHADLEAGRTAALVDCADIDSITCSDSCPQKAYALHRAAPTRVTIISALDTVASSGNAVRLFLENCNTVAVASADDAKNAAAFHVLNESTDAAKNAAASHMHRRFIDANRNGFTQFESSRLPVHDVRSTLAFAVPTGVPEQPVGDAQGVAGARHRLAVLRDILSDTSRMPCVAFESFMREVPLGVVGHFDPVTMRLQDGVDINRLVQETAAVKLGLPLLVDTVCCVAFDKRGAEVGPAFEESAVPPQAEARAAIVHGQIVGARLQAIYGLATKASWIDHFALRRRTRENQLAAAYVGALYPPGPPGKMDRALGR